MDEKRKRASEGRHKVLEKQYAKNAEKRPKGWLVERLMASPFAVQTHGVINHIGKSHRGQYREDYK